MVLSSIPGWALCFYSCFRSLHQCKESKDILPRPEGIPLWVEPESTDGDDHQSEICVPPVNDHDEQTHLILPPVTTQRAGLESAELPGAVPKSAYVELVLPSLSSQAKPDDPSMLIHCVSLVIHVYVFCINVSPCFIVI